jgi:hypothetical protein
VAALLRWREPPIEGMPHGYRLAAGRWVPLLDRALGAIEAPVANALLRDAPVRPIFLVGAFRSGTTLVERILCRHPDVASFCYFSNQFIHSPVLAAWGIRVLARLGVLDLEPHGFIHNPKLPSNLFSSFECEWIYSLCGRSLWDIENASMELDAKFSDERFERQLASLVRRHLWLFGKRRFVNKNPYNSLRVGFLARVFPDAIFVRVLRHPLATIASHAQTQAKLEAALMSTPGGMRIYRDGLHMDVLSAPARTARREELLALEGIDRRLALAAQWRDFQDAIDRALSSDAELRSRVHEIRYEDLMADPRRSLVDLFRNAGLDDASCRPVLDAAAASIQPELPDATQLAREAGALYPKLRELLASSAERAGYALPD